MRFREVKNSLPRSTANKWWSWYSNSVGADSKSCAFLFLCVPGSSCRKPGHFLEPSLPLESQRLCGEVAVTQSQACASPQHREEWALSPKSRSVECIWQAQPTQTRPAVQHTWGDAGSADGPVSLHHVCFYYWEECDRGASSPYFIPVSVWSAGMETTGSCGYSKQLLFLKHISLFWLLQ